MNGWRKFDYTDDSTFPNNPDALCVCVRIDENGEDYSMFSAFWHRINRGFYDGFVLVRTVDYFVELPPTNFLPKKKTSRKPKKNEKRIP